MVKMFNVYVMENIHCQYGLDWCRSFPLFDALAHWACVVACGGCGRLFISAWRFLACKHTIKLQDGKTNSIDAGRSQRS
jgi:hypothetical protein